MNSDQKLVATLGMILIVLVLWTSYKPAIKNILFSTGGTSSSGTNNQGGTSIGSAFGTVGGALLNPSSPLSPLNLLSYNAPDGQSTQPVPWP